VAEQADISRHTAKAESDVGTRLFIRKSVNRLFTTAKLRNFSVKEVLSMIFVVYLHLKGKVAKEVIEKKVYAQ
jgi:hypothetical protein